MKTLTVTCFAAILLASSSCKKESSDNFPQQSEGIWVPYELITETGDVEQGPFTFMTIFGSYAESLQLKRDKTYSPVIWQGVSNYSLRTQESGSYLHTSHQLILDSEFFDKQFEILKFIGDELWLRSGDRTYKLRREL